jgi:hypothetical protein
MILAAVRWQAVYIPSLQLLASAFSACSAIHIPDPAGAKKETFHRGWEGSFCVSRPVSDLEPRPKTVRGDFCSTNLKWPSDLLEPRVLGVK